MKTPVGSDSVQAGNTPLCHVTWQYRPEIGKGTVPVSVVSFIDRKKNESLEKAVWITDLIQFLCINQQFNQAQDNFQGPEAAECNWPEVCSA